ncbi:MAG: hypothetical protein AAGJ82_08515 [Bacteroidota bacterium]
MPFLAFLVILLCGAGLFWILAYLLRTRLRRVALVLGLLGLLVAFLLTGLWVVEAVGWERQGLYEQLMYGLEQEDLRIFAESQTDLQETTLLCYSQASIALSENASQLPNQDSSIVRQLRYFVAYVMDEERFKLWNNRRSWDRELFTLAHTAIILGNYQRLTGDQQYEERWKRICTFLVNGISRSQYKHLASRPGDAALRPTDNATALYALAQYDQQFGTDHLVVAGEDWSAYIRRELHYEDTKLPCAGFTATNRCRLPAVGGSLALLSVYTAGAELPISRDFWREFRHYYKGTFWNITAWINPMPTGGDQPEFCDFSVAPLQCYRYETSLGQYAASLRKDWITYYQLNNRLILRDFFQPLNRLWSKPQQEQLRGLYELAVRLSACAPVREAA